MKTLIVPTEDGIFVFLNGDDTSLGIATGRARHKKQGTKNFRQLDVSETISENIWILGALGELAVGRGLGLPWDGRIDNDVACYEIKTVAERHLRLLIPTRSRHLERGTIYISVTHWGIQPYGRDQSSWLVRGWTYVEEVLRDEYLDPCQHEERQPAWCLPNYKLHPMSTLPHP